METKSNNCFFKKRMLSYCLLFVCWCSILKRVKWNYWILLLIFWTNNWIQTLIYIFLEIHMGEKGRRYDSIWRLWIRYLEFNEKQDLKKQTRSFAFLWFPFFLSLSSPVKPIVFVRLMIWLKQRAIGSFVWSFSWFFDLN